MVRLGGVWRRWGVGRMIVNDEEVRDDQGWSLEMGYVRCDGFDRLRCGVRVLDWSYGAGL